MDKLKDWFSNIVYLFLPEVCHACGRHLSASESWLCADCFSKLPRTLYHRIPENTMEQRFAGFFPFERATGMLFYTQNSVVASLIHDFKYRKFPGLATYLGYKLGEELFLPGFFSEIDCIVPIPMHWTKKILRGYNQTEMLAKGVAEATSIPVVNYLKMTRIHKTQTSLSHEERRLNTTNLFSVVNPEDLSDKHILLLDDVCTTGATLRSAAETIIQANPSVKISLLTLAVT